MMARTSISSVIARNSPSVKPASSTSDGRASVR